jgi:hypothetical protein
MIFCLKDMLRKAEQHGLDDFKALVDQAKAALPAQQAA